MPTIGLDDTPKPLPVTEAIHSGTADLDTRSFQSIVAAIHGEDLRAACAVGSAGAATARAARRLCDVLRVGGVWFNMGAGTSGRMGCLDAAEIPPTFGLDADRVQGVIAGGPRALLGAVEGAEDDVEAALHDLKERDLSGGDALLAISASGRTPYTVAGLRYARSRGATALALTCDPDSPLAKEADLAIVTEVGPEVIAGSTRMKGGVAQKMVLHQLSTAVMVRMGRVNGNLMSHLRPASQKLKRRAEWIHRTLGP